MARRDEDVAAVIAPWTVVEIANRRGMRARLADYGARLIELWTPDRDGNLR